MISTKFYVQVKAKVALWNKEMNTKRYRFSLHQTTEDVLTITLTSPKADLSVTVSKELSDEWLDWLKEKLKHRAIELSCAK